MMWALQTLWYERRRYFPGVLAVAFSSLLIALQVGIFWGLISVVSTPIVHSKADIWIAYPQTKSVDLGRPLPNYWRDRIAALPEVIRDDQYIQGMAIWKTPREETELTIVAGCTLTEDSLGPVALLTEPQRRLLEEPGAVILDEVDCQRLGVEKNGEAGLINNQPVRVVGFVRNMGSLTGPYSLCSLETARKLLGLREDQTTFLLAKLEPGVAVEATAAKLAQFTKFSVHESQAFALDSKVHWLTKTKAGAAVTFIALLGLTVGAVVTSQTLYAAVAASSRELAVLFALGIPRDRIQSFIVMQSFIVGVLGLAIGLPGSIGLGSVARYVGANADMAPWILISTGVVTFVMAMASGVFALRSLRLAEPISLLR